MALTPKRKGAGLEIKTIMGASGCEYLVMRTPDGGYHVFVEVEAKEAAQDCGASSNGNTRAQWDGVLRRADGNRL